MSRGLQRTNRKTCKIVTLYHWELLRKRPSLATVCTQSVIQGLTKSVFLLCEMWVCNSTIAEDSNLMDVSVSAWIINPILKDNSVFEMSGTIYPSSHPRCYVSSVFVLYTNQRRACVWWSVLYGQNVFRWSQATEKSGLGLCCIWLACMQWPAHTEVWIFGFLFGWLSTVRSFVVGKSYPGGVKIFLHLAVKIRILYQCQNLEFSDF
jgi:hypothetical protein